MKKKLLWTICITVVVLFIATPVFHILKTKWYEEDVIVTTPKGFTNDASQLNLTRVDTIIQAHNDKKEIETQLKNVLDYSRENHLKISIAV